MAGRGAPPKPQSRTRHKPIRGSWQAKPGIGWQHGDIPAAPDGLRPVAEAAWTVWMQSWFASHWTRDDLPGLAVAIGLYDQVRRAFDDPFVESEGPRGGPVYVRRPNPVTELRQMMDTYGITPKGQQDRRWAPPKADEPAAAPTADAGGRYANLKVV